MLRDGPMVNFGGTDRTSFVDLQEGMGPEIVKVCSQLMCIKFSKPKRDVRLTCVSACAAVVSTDSHISNAATPHVS